MTSPSSQLPRISVAIGHKYNMGNYQSKDVHFSVSLDIKEGEDLSTVKRDLTNLLTEWHQEEYMKIRDKVKKG